jgi:hypothetical protein
LLSLQFQPDLQVGAGGEGCLGTQHPCPECQYQPLEGQSLPAGGDGGEGGPPLGRQHLLVSHQNSELLQLELGGGGAGGAAGGAQHLLSFQVQPELQVGAGGEGCLGTQHPCPECQYQPLEGQLLPAGGDGGEGGPPLGRQHLLVSHQNSELLQLELGEGGAAGGAQHLLSFQLQPGLQVGGGGDGRWGTQQLSPVCQYQPLEGQALPAGGDGGEGSPPMGRQQLFVSYQNSLLLQLELVAFTAGRAAASNNRAEPSRTSMGILANEKYTTNVGGVSVWMIRAVNCRGKSWERRGSFLTIHHLEDSLYF